MFSIKAFLLNISVGSHLIPLLLFLFFIKRNREKDIRVIFWYCVYSFINDLLVTDAFNINIGNDSTFLFLSIFTIVEYVLFSIAIYLNLKKGLFKRIILWFSPFFIIFCLFLFFNRGGKNDIDSISITVEYILIIAYCLFFFFEELNEPNTTFIYASYKFWIIVGILIYSTGTFFFFMNSSDLTDEQWDKWSAINYVGTIIKNAFFSVAMVLKKAKPPESNPPFDNKFDGFEKPITPL